MTQKVLNYKHIATGERAHYVFGDIGVLHKNLQIKYGSLMAGANPPVWVDGDAICFDHTRVTDVRFGATYDA